MNDANRFQEESSRFAIYPSRPTGKLSLYALLGLSGEVGEVSEFAKKLIRDRDGLDAMIHGIATSVSEAFELDFDDVKRVVSRSLELGIELSPEQEANLKKELGDVLWYVSELATTAGIPLSEIMSGNIEKLTSRAERGKLSGSGDNR